MSSMAAGAPTVPDSPTPFTPSGFHGAGVTVCARISSSSPGMSTARGIAWLSPYPLNASAFVITVILTALLAASPDKLSGLAMAAWIGLLFLANAIFHIVGTLAHGRYCPGVITATLLYLPYGTLLLASLVRDLKLPSSAVVTAAAIGAVPMLAHGYLIVFRGSRLF